MWSSTAIRFEQLADQASGQVREPGQCPRRLCLSDEPFADPLGTRVTGIGGALAGLEIEDGVVRGGR